MKLSIFREEKFAKTAFVIRVRKEKKSHGSKFSFRTKKLK